MFLLNFKKSTLPVFVFNKHTFPSGTKRSEMFPRDVGSYWCHLAFSYYCIHKVLGQRVKVLKVVIDMRNNKGKGKKKCLSACCMWTWH